MPPINCRRAPWLGEDGSAALQIPANNVLFTSLNFPGLITDITNTTYLDPFKLQKQCREPSLSQGLSLCEKSKWFSD